VATIVAPADAAISISPLITGTTASPPFTERLPAGSAKSFCTSTMTSAVDGE